MAYLYFQSVLIFGKKEDIIASAKDLDPSRPVIILCGANGAVYEFSSFKV